jgi:HNH endonuclease
VNPNYTFVAERAAHRCEYCKAPEVIFNFAFDVEHIVPPGLGGANTETNQALACRSCNLYKSDHVQALDDVTGASVTLFRPGEDEWSDHFDLIKDSATIVGRTPKAVPLHLC